MPPGDVLGSPKDVRLDIPPKSEPKPNPKDGPPDPEDPIRRPKKPKGIPSVLEVKREQSD